MEKYTHVTLALCHHPWHCAIVPDEPYDLSPAAAAAIIGCHEDTLKRWTANGKVPAFRTPGGWWRFRRSDIEAFLAGDADTEAAS